MSHPTPSPERCPPTKKQRVDTEERANAKRDRKRVQHLRKAYAKQVAKHGDPPILFDILEMIGRDRVEDIVAKGQEYERVSPFNEEVTVTIERLSAHGDGLALSPRGDRLLVVPFALPGEQVRVFPYAAERLYFKARVVEMVQPNPAWRDDSLVQCRYFGQCGGCQYQMIPYSKQLEQKKTVVENAFKHYAHLDASLVPAVLDTMASPQTMSYRTKLTPHFDLPSILRKKGPSSSVPDSALSVPIGFDGATLGRVMDIEECPIGTPILNEAMKAQRARVRETIRSYKNGATLLLRDSLPSADASMDESMAVTDHKATVYERVGPITFSTPAGAFFQNNRSIIPLVVDYVKHQLPASEGPQYLVDTYCGSGLFALTLASLFDEVAGVEISADSIACAEKNAALNHITNAKFLAGQAENIFGRIEYPSEKTTVVIDPPRRGCDQAFLDQLVALQPKHIIYVSCNVHVRILTSLSNTIQTQARDVGQLLRACPSYQIRSIRGFDFFPQTQYVSDVGSNLSHVEGVCVLEHASS